MGSWARSFAKNAVAGEAGLKRYRPVTPGLRHRVITRRSDLHKGPPVRALTEAKKRIDGRNNHGKASSVWIGKHNDTCAVSSRLLEATGRPAVLVRQR